MAERNGNWMQTFTGKKFWPADPRPEEVEIEDIAHSLSRIVRFGGHIERPYTVAQHSILVSRQCREPNALWGLLHDATEAYIGDMISPVKDMFPEFKALERKIMDAIVEKFKLNCLYEPYDVWEADKRMVRTEHRLLRYSGGDPLQLTLWKPAEQGKLQPYPWGGIEVMDHDEAKRAFLERFSSLRQDAVGCEKAFSGQDTCHFARDFDL